MKKYSALFVALTLSVYLSSGCSSGYTVKPSVADAKYGPHERNTFDFWQAESSSPAPLVVYIHGGGFSSGSKEKISAGLTDELLVNGISVMTINYRLTPDAVYPEHYMDCARAIQYARYHAKDLNIDPARIGAAGSSAGACTALWIGFHDDLADPGKADPVLRMSTRLSGVAMYSGQSTLEPGVIREWFGDTALKHSFFKGEFFGISKEEVNTPNGVALFKQASPITHLSNDDPPVWAYYSVPRREPTTVSEAVHHYKFGEYLKSKTDAAGIECILLDNETRSVTENCIAFFTNAFNRKK